MPVCPQCSRQGAAVGAPCPECDHSLLVPEDMAGASNRQISSEQEPVSGDISVQTGQNRPLETPQFPGESEADRQLSPLKPPSDSKSDYRPDDSAEIWKIAFGTIFVMLAFTTGSMVCSTEPPTSKPKTGSEAQSNSETTVVKQKKAVRLARLSIHIGVQSGARIANNPEKSIESEAPNRSVGDMLPAKKNVENKYPEPPSSPGKGQKEVDVKTQSPSNPGDKSRRTESRKRERSDADDDKAKKQWKINTPQLPENPTEPADSGQQGR